MWCTCDCCFSIKNVKKSLSAFCALIILYVRTLIPRKMELEVRKQEFFCAINFHFFTFAEFYFQTFFFEKKREEKNEIMRSESTPSVILRVYIINSFWYVSNTSFFLFCHSFSHICIHSMLSSYYYTCSYNIFIWRIFMCVSHEFLSVRDVFDSSSFSVRDFFAYFPLFYISAVGCVSENANKIVNFLCRCWNEREFSESVKNFIGWQENGFKMKVEMKLW